jgi:hypothetical protein
MALSNDPAKLRQWQQASKDRAIEKALERMKAKGSKLAPRETGRKAPIVRSGQLHSQPPAERPAKPAAKRAQKGPKHNDSPWRAACIAIRGEMCRACGDTHHVEMDHVIPKSQRPSLRHDVRNGLPLCGAFSRVTPGGCHPKKTAGTLEFQFGWFDADQIAFLAAEGWVDWDDSGQPFGAGMKHFGERRHVRKEQE